MTNIDRLSFRGAALLMGFCALGALGATGCVTTPTDGEALPSAVSLKNFQGYSLTPSAAVVVQAFNHKTSQWETIGQGTSSATVSIAANTAGQNPELYAFSVSARVANESNPSTFCRWRSFDPNCANLTLADLGSCDFAKVRVQVGGLNALTYTAQGDDCIQQEMSSGTNAVQAAINCQSDNSPNITLSAAPGGCIF
jgi:hypothetical protein